MRCNERSYFGYAHSFPHIVAHRLAACSRSYAHLIGIGIDAEFRRSIMVLASDIIAAFVAMTSGIIFGPCWMANAAVRKNKRDR